MNDIDLTDKSVAVELLSFRAGGQDYAIDIGSTREIRSWTTPSEMPDAPADMLGVINLRGEVLPLLDLAGRLGLPTPEVNERSVIIVAELDNEPIGLLVDAVSDIIAPSEDDLQRPSDAVSRDEQPCVRALTLIGKKLVRVLELSSLKPAQINLIPQVCENELQKFQ
ncbi:chemotaxis protein CheW [Roseobacter sinensis]|uniref:Chemotaxis protein CheW n=1 Tax=Roseobacter sinensis TaxID=2931391 RepID=A0ABT3BLI1_9RHOB|nr:chemotaxis protein CheW [Roseobacter sp. WL0113]MCV3274426.1 chemotaxis protein CheW [Roseobacter sp. WL0113]